METIADQPQAPFATEMQPAETRIAETRIGLTARFSEMAARIGNTARGMCESFRHNVDRYKAIGQATLALSGLTAGAEAVNAAFNADPAMAGASDVPTRTAEPFEVADRPLLAAVSTAATASSLKQDCATDIFKLPQVLPSSGMYHAGKKRQSFDVELGFGSVDSACDGYFERLPYFRPQLVRHGHAINESPRWIPLFTPGYDPNVAGNFGFTYTRSLTDPKYKYWRPGDKVRFKLSIREFSLAAKKVVGRSATTTHRIPVVNRTP